MTKDKIQNLLKICNRTSDEIKDFIITEYYYDDLITSYNGRLISACPLFEALMNPQADDYLFVELQDIDLYNQFFQWKHIEDINLRFTDYGFSIVIHVKGYDEDEYEKSFKLTWYF